MPLRDIILFVFFTSWLASGYYAHRVLAEAIRLRHLVKKKDPSINVAFFFFDLPEKKYFLSHMGKSFTTFFRSFTTFGSVQVIEQELDCYMEVDKVKALRDTNINKTFRDFVSANSMFVRILLITLVFCVFIYFI